MTVEYTQEEVEDILAGGLDGKNAVPYPVEMERLFVAKNAARKYKRSACASDGEYAWLRVNVCVDYKYEKGDAERVQITSSRDVDRFLRGAIPIEGSGTELFAAVAMNAKNEPIGVYVVHRGGISASVVDPVAVLQPAVALLASGMIICHNHPSQHPEPSPADVEITERVGKASGILGIRLLDHLIITQSGGYFSFLDAGLLPIKP